MINVLNMEKKIGVDNGGFVNIKFDFEFDDASALPKATYIMGQKTYVIAPGSTARKMGVTNYYYSYDSNNNWARVLATPPTINTANISNIEENGNYNIVNSIDGYNSINVNTLGDIPSVLTTKNIISNGIYKAEDDNVEGYSEVNVNVANTYTAEDEGKVVDNGNLVTQTAYPTTITENDTYDTTNYNSITVDVSSSSSIVTICTFDFIENQFLFEDESGTIGDNAFNECTELTSITIPSSVTSIGYSAFNSCTALETVTFEENSSLETVGNYAFYSCNELTSITIPSGVTYIGEHAFHGCWALTSITIPSGVTSIETAAFSDCSTITSITIPSNVISIGDYAFNGCYALTSVTIPDSVTSIGEYAFCNCALTSITIPNSVTSIGNDAFNECNNLETVTFEENSSLESIGGNAFYDCFALTSITIPNGVESIGEYAFYECTTLTSITFEPTTPPTLDGELGIPTTCTIRVPQGTLSAYTSASYYPDPSTYTYEEY